MTTTDKELQNIINEVSRCVVGVIAKADQFRTRSTCIHCIHFNQATEICAKAKGRPPAKIIAYGCELYKYDEIPY